MKKVMGFRFDPFESVGMVSVDWIRFADSEANIVTEKDKIKAIKDSDTATHIVKKYGTLAPAGGVEIKNLALAGDIDMSEGYVMVTDKAEIADNAEHAVYTLDMAAAGITADDTMYISGYSEAVTPVDGADYIIKTYRGSGYVAFKKKDSSELSIVVHGDVEEDAQTTFFVAQYNNGLLVRIDMLNHDNMPSGEFSCNVGDGNSVKIIMVENTSNIKPVFRATVIE